MDNTIKTTVSGKAILVGEHFVLSGVPAIAFGVPSLKTSIQISFNNKTENTYRFLSSEPTTTEEENGLIEKMKSAVQLAQELFSVNLKNYEIISETNTPLSRGFGSSAAFSVALVRTFKQLTTVSGVNLFKAAQQIETLFHGTPSGLDTTAILANTQGEKIIRFHSLNHYESIDFKAGDFLVVDGGIRGSCASLIERTKDKKMSFVEEMKILSERTYTALKENHLSSLAQCIRRAHEILADLSLSTPEIEKIRQIASHAGALESKVSGAGAGGAIVVLVEKEKSTDVAQALQNKGYKVYR